MSNRRKKVLAVAVGSSTTSNSLARVYRVLDHPDFDLDIVAVLPWPYREGERGREADIAQVMRYQDAADVILLHRVLFPPRLRQQFRAFKKPLVYDIDDAIYIVPSESYHGEAGSPLGWGKRLVRRVLRGRSNYSARFRPLVALLQQVDAVAAGNPYLAAFAARYCREVAVVPTVVDVAHFPIKQHTDDTPVTIGWYGSPSNHWYLSTIHPALQQIAARFGPQVRVEVISAQPYQRAGLRVEWTPWDAESELAQLLRFDIGLMPLTEDDWARGKSANKAIYYMALGIPAVVSPVGVNSEVVLDGQTGFHARTTEEWVARLTQLIVDRDLRTALGQRGRQHMLAHYSKGVAARKLSALLHDTIARREQGQVAPAIPRVADAQPG